MPSGAKKRKAAKKKKEKEANINPSTNNPQGSNELKSQDEKGSDGGEGNSPAYHDHDDHNHPFNEGNEEVEETDPSAADTESMEEVPSGIKIDEVVGGQEDGGIVIERDFKSEESSESKTVSVVHIESARESEYGNENFSGSSNDENLDEKNSKDDPDNSIKEMTTFDELVKSVDSSHATMTLQQQQQQQSLFPLGGVHATMTLITENAPVEETGNSVVESSVNSVNAAASVSEVKSSETGNALLDDKASASSRSPFTESANGAEYVKDSDTPECSENQPLVTSAPRLVPKTSWLSCCGLLEVLSGSDR